jgi:hypothetical protein
MKHYLLGFSIIVLGAAAVVPTTYAQSDAMPVQEKAARLKNLIQEAKNARDQKQANTEEGVVTQVPAVNNKNLPVKATGEKISSKIKSLAEARQVAVVGRYFATVIRLGTINNRLGQRVSTLTESGVDTTEAQKLVLENSQILAQVSTQLEALKAGLAQEIAQGSTRGEAIKNLRSNLEQVRETLRTVWNNEREAITLLKAGTPTTTN